MGRLEGKRALITGGASGMGAAQAELFVREGASVLIADMNEKGGQQLAVRLGEHAAFFALDVRDADNWTRAVEAAENHCHGPIDILSNTAGILRTGTIESTSLETYRLCVDIMQVGTFLGMRAIVPSMRRANGGSIINMSSTAGMVGYSDLIAYSAAKWAVRGMTKAAALDLAPYDIRVNSVHPGNTDTPMIRDLNYSADGVPLRRNATAEEVAALILFLASDESTYITGTEHVIDGGATASGLVAE